MTTSRRGRPPKVRTVGEDTYSVTVSGQSYQFRHGSDGRLRALGNPSRDNPDYEFARTIVSKAIEGGEQEHDNDEG